MSTINVELFGFGLRVTRIVMNLDGAGDGTTTKTKNIQ